MILFPSYYRFFFFLFFEIIWCYIQDNSVHAGLREWCTENLMWLSCELTKVMGQLLEALHCSLSGALLHGGQGRMGWGIKFVPLLV